MKSMKRLKDLLDICLPRVNEVFPWDLLELRQRNPELLLLDVREPYEFAAAHIPGSINVPRGILETACEYGYEDTHPELAASREREVVVICRSGNRSVLAAWTLQVLGYRRVHSLKTGVRGWNDYEQPLQDGGERELTQDEADAFFTPHLTPAQLGQGWVTHRWQS